MARIVPLWNSEEISLYRFDHPAEHEDQPYEACADAHRASFVEVGSFRLEVDGSRWRVSAGDVMLSHPGMRFRAGYDDQRFNDTCISLVYRTPQRDAFDRTRRWVGRERRVLTASNRLRYLRWLLQNAEAQRMPMLAEFVASEVFVDRPCGSADLFRDHKFDWYAERVQAVRERLDAEFETNHTAIELARSVGMSTFHFTRVFSALVGQPPHRYLTEQRLRNARRMLAEGRNVTETCFACGFNGLSHFTRSFGRRYGRPPSHFVRKV